MLIYDKAYVETKTKYLIPLTYYSVSYAQLRKLNIKAVILSKSTSIDISNDNGYIFHFEESDILKGILGDIKCFM